MNDDIQSLEAELRRLRPRQPSEQLRERLNASFSEVTRKTGSVFQEVGSRKMPGAKVFAGWPWVLWPSMIIGAAAVLFIAVHQDHFDVMVATDKTVPPASRPLLTAAPQSDASALTPQYKPVTAERLVLGASSDGFVTLSDGTLARRVRQLSVDTYVWRDARTNASLRWSIPREDLRVVPASYH